MYFYQSTICLIITVNNWIANAYYPVPLNDSNKQDGPKIFKTSNADLLWPIGFNKTSEGTITFPILLTSSTSSFDNATAKPELDLSTLHTHATSVEYTTLANILYVTPIETNNRTKSNINESLEQSKYMREEKLISNALNDDLVTGRAVGSINQYHKFGQSIEPLIRNKSDYDLWATNLKTVYPTLFNTKVIADRFSPSEAVALNQYKGKEQEFYRTQTINSPMYKSVPSIYSNIDFPPNIDFPNGYSTDIQYPSTKVNSYAPPPSGPLNQSNHNLHSGLNINIIKDNSPYSIMNTDTADDTAYIKYMPDIIGVLPASAMQPNVNKTIINSIVKDIVNKQKHNSNHHLLSYESSEEYLTPPPGWMDDNPNNEIPFETSHNEYSQSNLEIPNYPKLSKISIHPHSNYLESHHDKELYYPHYVQIPVSTTMMPSTTTSPPLEGRVKKYSYFYIGRKLWYIPLYFTVWFSFYVLWLILKSIARHKVNLPNHYVNRRSLENENLSNNFGNKYRDDFINQQTIKIMNQIYEFTQKYL